ncbi:hypothetical protein C8Q72DRAFT_794236 [Fomitopsis betulina]|nr:hypothetical protein C8Q72DRAFT_794236 [Fomitopsis betulina]
MSIVTDIFDGERPGLRLALCRDSLNMLHLEKYLRLSASTVVPKSQEHMQRQMHVVLTGKAGMWSDATRAGRHYHQQTGFWRTNLTAAVYCHSDSWSLRNIRWKVEVLYDDGQYFVIVTYMPWSCEHHQSFAVGSQIVIDSGPSPATPELPFAVHVALLWRILSYALRSFDTRDIHFGMLKPWSPTIVYAPSLLKTASGAVVALTPCKVQVVAPQTSAAGQQRAVHVSVRAYALWDS